MVYVHDIVKYIVLFPNAIGVILGGGAVIAGYITSFIFKHILVFDLPFLTLLPGYLCNGGSILFVITSLGTSGCILDGTPGKWLLTLHSVTVAAFLILYIFVLSVFHKSHMQAKGNFGNATYGADADITNEHLNVLTDNSSLNVEHETIHSTDTLPQVSDMDVKNDYVSKILDVTHLRNRRDQFVSNINISVENAVQSAKDKANSVKDSINERVELAKDRVVQFSHSSNLKATTTEHSSQALEDMDKITSTEIKAGIEELENIPIKYGKGNTDRFTKFKGKIINTAHSVKDGVVESAHTAKGRIEERLHPVMDRVTETVHTVKEEIIIGKVKDIVEGTPRLIKASTTLVNDLIVTRGRTGTDLDDADSDSEHNFGHIKEVFNSTKSKVLDTYSKGKSVTEKILVKGRGVAEKIVETAGKVYRLARTLTITLTYTAFFFAELFDKLTPEEEERVKLVIPILGTLTAPAFRFANTRLAAIINRIFIILEIAFLAMVAFLISTKET